MRGQVVDGGLSLQEVAQAIGNREQPLSNWQALDDVAGKVGDYLNHAAGIAELVDVGSLAGISSQPGSCARGQHSGHRQNRGQGCRIGVTVEFPRDVGWRRRSVAMREAAHAMAAGIVDNCIDAQVFVKIVT